VLSRYQPCPWSLSLPNRPSHSLVFGPAGWFQNAANFEPRPAVAMTRAVAAADAGTRSPCVLLQARVWRTPSAQCGKEYKSSYLEHLFVNAQQTTEG
jgi:hypothetical protein